MQDCPSPLDCVNLLCGGDRGVSSRGSAVQREAWQSMQPKGARPAEPALQKHPVLEDIVHRERFWVLVPPRLLGLVPDEGPASWRGGGKGG